MKSIKEYNQINSVNESSDEKSLKKDLGNITKFLSLIAKTSKSGIQLARNSNDESVVSLMDEIEEGLDEYFTNLEDMKYQLEAKLGIDESVEETINEASAYPKTNSLSDAVIKIYNQVDNYELPDISYGEVMTVIDNMSEMDEKSKKDFFKKYEELRKTDEKTAKQLAELWKSITDNR